MLSYEEVMNYGTLIKRRISRKDLYVGRKVLLSELLDITDTYIYLSDFRQLPAVMGEGVVKYVSDVPLRNVEDCVMYHMSKDEYLACHALEDYDE